MSRTFCKDPKVWIGVLLSASFIWLALRGVNPPRISEVFRSADYHFLPPAALISLVAIWLRSLRWQVLMSGLKEIRISSLFKATTIGFMANYVLPARAGEFVRAYLVGTKAGVSRSAAFATIVVERLVDVLSILLVFLGVVILVHLPQGDIGLQRALTVAAIAFSSLACLGVMGLWVVRRRTHWMIAAMEKALPRISPGLLRGLSKLIVSFSQGVVPIRRKRDAVAIGVYTVLLWIVTAGGIMLVAEAFHLEIPWEAAWVILVALAFGVSIPSAPGFVGTFHYAAIAGLVIYGVPRSEALSYAVVLHATNIVPVLILGMVFVWDEGLKLGTIMQLRRNALERQNDRVIRET